LIKVLDTEKGTFAGSLFFAIKKLIAFVVKIA